MTVVRSYKVLLLGDFSYGESYEGGGARVIQEKGYDYSTIPLKRFIEASDSFIVNLETPLAAKKDFPSPYSGKKPWIHWADPVGTGRALRALQVDAVGLANNHTLDLGHAGLEATFTNLNELKLPYFGAGTNREEAEKPFIIHLPKDLGGGQISIYGSFQYSKKADEDFGVYANSSRSGTAKLGTYRAVSPHKYQNDPDSLNVAFPHWGPNYVWKTSRQTNMAHTLIEAGYDVVIGHGSHAMQEVDSIDGRLVLYSIGNGNFQSAGRWKKYEEDNGILPYGFWTILQVDLYENGERRVTVKLYPVKSNNRLTNYQPSPVNEDEFNDVVNAITQRSTPSLSSHILEVANDDLGHYLCLHVADWKPGHRPTGVKTTPVNDVTPEAPSSNLECIKVEVQGPFVQGVGFRRWLKSQADAQHLTGWVRNREIDTVEALLIGSSNGLSAVTPFLIHGPSKAQVSAVKMWKADPLVLKSFEILDEIPQPSSIRSAHKSVDTNRGEPKGFNTTSNVHGYQQLDSVLNLLGSSTSFEFSGDCSIPFRGLEVRASYSSVKDRFYVFPDDNWPIGTRKRFREARRGDLLSRLMQAHKRGALGYVVPKAKTTNEVLQFLRGKNFFIVENTHAFAWDLLNAARSASSDCLVTAITGAAGKSTTQNMLAHVLRSLNQGRILVPGNNQNMYESAVWQLSRLERFSHAVLEVSGTAAQRIQGNGYSIGANVAVVTAIAEAHLTGNEGLKEVAIRKATIFHGPPADGVAIINIDTPYSELLVNEAVKSGRRVITYGESEVSDIRLVKFSPHANEATVHFNGREFRYQIAAPGKHMALNSLAVLATLDAYSIPNWQNSLDAFSTFGALEGRGETRQLTLGGSSITLIDESFNANPASMRASIESFKQTWHDAPGERTRLVAILGDMLEMGGTSKESHESLASSLVDADLDLVLLFGSDMKHLKEKLTNSNNVHYWETLEELAEELSNFIMSKDVVLAKASHGTGLMDWLKSQH